MKLLSEVFKSVKKKKKNQPANWSLTLTWLVGFKPTRDRVLLLTNQIYHSSQIFYKTLWTNVTSPPPPPHTHTFYIYCLIKDEVLLTVSCPIFPSILIAKNLLTGSLKNRSIDNLETQKKSISMKNSQFFDYLLYAKLK